MRIPRAGLAFLLVASSMAFALGPVSAAEGPVEVTDAQDQNVTLGMFWLLDSNSTENLTVRLVADLLPPYHANEPFQVGVLWSTSYEEEDENRTVEVRLGLGMEGPPGSKRIVVRGPFPGNGTDGADSDPAREWMALSTVEPREGDGEILATVVTGEGQLNLTFPVTVLPARVVLTAWIASPDGNWSGPELAWTEVPVLLVNDGGAPATDLTVDFRYDGRIAATHFVPLVPPRSNHTVLVNLFLIHGFENLSVHLVTGPGAPDGMGDLHVQVLARPVLDVLSVTAEPTKVETGSKVRIEAVVGNRGNATSDGQLVELMVDGSVVANASLIGLEPGNETVVSTDWTLRGEGIHTVSAHAEGDDLASHPVPINVVAKSPPVGAIGVLSAVACALLVRRAGRR